MSVTLTERIDSREFAGGTWSFHYTLEGTSDESLAKALILNSTPDTYDGRVRDLDISMAATWVDTTTGNGSWDCTVQYVTAEKVEPEPGESSYSFDTGGGTQHITQGLQTIATYAPPGKTATDHKGAIGVTKDSIEGVDITVPVYTWSETHCFTDQQVTQDYKNTLFLLTGRTNNAAFKGFAAGEVLFLGASGSKRGSGNWEITFRFAASPNKTGITIGTIVNVEKKGWEYLWVEYAPAEDGASHRLAQRPVGAYVERVYEAGTLESIGIGTT